MRKKRIEIKSLLFVWKQGEKGERKKNNTFCFPLKKNNICFLLLYPYKCERYIKVINKYVTSCHIMLFTWDPFKKNHYLPSNLPKLGGLQIFRLKRNGFCLFIFFHGSQIEERLSFFSFLFSSFLIQHFETYSYSSFESSCFLLVFFFSFQLRHTVF